MPKLDFLAYKGSKNKKIYIIKLRSVKRLLQY